MTLTERLTRRIKNNPIVAVVIILAAVAAGAAQFAGSIKILSETFGLTESETAKRKRALALDLTDLEVTLEGSIRSIRADVLVVPNNPSSVQRSLVNILDRVTRQTDRVCLARSNIEIASDPKIAPALALICEAPPFFKKTIELPDLGLTTRMLAGAIALEDTKGCAHSLATAINEGTAFLDGCRIQVKR